MDLETAKNYSHLISSTEKDKLACGLDMDSTLPMFDSVLSCNCPECLDAFGKAQVAADADTEQGGEFLRTYDKSEHDRAAELARDAAAAVSTETETTAQAETADKLDSASSEVGSESTNADRPDPQPQGIQSPLIKTLEAIYVMTVEQGRLVKDALTEMGV